MKLIKVCLFIFAALSLVIMQVEAARGGGGHVGHGGGGGHVGQGGGVSAHIGAGRSARPNIAKSPSMSRVVPRTPQRTAMTPGQNRMASRNQVQQFLTHSPHQQSVQQLRTQAQNRQLSTARPNAGQRPQLKGAQLQAAQTNIAQRQHQGKLTSGKVADQIRHNRTDYGSWFNNDFFARHNYNHGFGQGNLWRAARWGDVNSWLGWGNAYPIYYDSEDYGYGDYPYTDTGYADAGSYTAQFGPQVVTPSQQDLQPVYNTYGGAQPQGDWLPLGVFAVGNTPEQAAISNMIIQLAVNKQGEISGTYYNSATDQVRALDGMVVAQTQQAAWKLAEKSNSPLVTTGMYDLTQDVVPIQVHNTDNSIQNKILVRLNQGT